MTDILERLRRQDNMPTRNKTIADAANEIECLRSEVARLKDEGTKDYEDMRKFQSKYIASDHEVRRQKEQISLLREALNKFDPSEPVGDAYMWVGPQPEEVDAALAATEGEK